MKIGMPTFVNMLNINEKDHRQSSQEDMQLSEINAPKKELSKKELDQAVESLKKLKPKGIDFEFEYSKDVATEKYFLKIISSDTNEVIKQIPSQDYLEMIAKLSNKESLFFDEVV